MKTSDIVVHLQRPLAADERERLEQALQAAKGIAAVRGSPRARQLILVHYDRAMIGPLGVLDRVRDLGLEARLIGM